MITRTPFRRILLVALDNLGDLVFASALTQPLQHAFPDATIDVWCKEYTADVAALMPCVRDVIAADPFWAVRPAHPRPPMGPFLRSIADVRRRQYELAVLSEAPWRASAAVAAAQIPVRIGTARHRNVLFLTHVLAAEDPTRPVVREQARLLAALGVPSDSPRYQLHPSRLGAIRDEIGRQLPPGFVAVHPFASVQAKRGPLVEWLQVADALHQRDRHILWIGTPKELSEISDRRSRSDESFVDTLGEQSLRTTAAALSHAALFLGHDSGPLHIANAFGVPVVDVFSTGNPVRYGPQGIAPSRVLFYERGDAMTARDILREIDALEAVRTP